MNFIQENCRRFSLYFKSTFHSLLQVYCITQKMHISQELAFLCESLFSVARHNSSVLFHLNLYTWDKGSPSKCKFSDLSELIKFLMSFFKPPVKFSLSIASPFSVMTHNSSVIFQLKQYILCSKGAH